VPNRPSRIGGVLLLVLAAAAWTSVARVVPGAIRRNACAVRLAGDPADQCAGAIGMRASDRVGRADRLAEARAIREAAQLQGAGRPADAIARLDAITQSESRDALVWYALGNAFEDAHRPDRAEECYRRALTIDRMAAAAPGRFFLSALYAARGDWPGVLSILADAPLRATAAQERPCGLCRAVDWPAASLLRANALQQTGRTADAAAAYRSFIADRPAARDWQDNRALVFLGTIEVRQGATADAVQHFGRALQLTLEFPPTFMRAYQHDTWQQVRDAADAGAALHAAARAAVDAAPRNAGLWLVLAATSLTACDATAAQRAGAQAEAIEPAAASFATRMRLPSACESRPDGRDGPGRAG
jgi:tetratricopeptide (TPR) repeat protein